MSTLTPSAVAEHIAQTLHGWQSNPGVWSVPCPAHGGTAISLHLTHTGVGLQPHCEGGCRPEDAILALRARDLWPAGFDYEPSPHHERLHRQACEEADQQTRQRLELAQAQWRATHFSARDLQADEPPALHWTVPEILVPGLTVLGGRLGAGKSALAWSLTLAVAGGTTSFGPPAASAPVLYLALDDHRSRLAARLQPLLTELPSPDQLHIWTVCDRLDGGGLNSIESWLAENPEARLIVIDTYRRVAPTYLPGQNGANQNAVSARLAALARHPNLSILLLHHLRRRPLDDTLDLLHTLAGPVATPDAFLLLNQRTPQDADLSVLPAALPPREFALQRDVRGAAWKVTGDAAEQRLSQSRRQILALFAVAPTPLTPTQVAALLDKPITTARSTLWRMAADGLLIATHGHYHPPPDRAEQSPPLPRAGEQSPPRPRAGEGAGG